MFRKLRFIVVALKFEIKSVKFNWGSMARLYQFLVNWLQMCIIEPNQKLRVRFAVSVKLDLAAL